MHEARRSHERSQAQAQAVKEAAGPLPAQGRAPALRWQGGCECFIVDENHIGLERLAHHSPGHLRRRWQPEGKRRQSGVAPGGAGPGGAGRAGRGDGEKDGCAAAVGRRAARRAFQRGAPCSQPSACPGCPRTAPRCPPSPLRWSNGPGSGGGKRIEVGREWKKKV